jgi:hypothetical protein
LERDNHLKIHNRPFKCPEPNCEFADIGFISEKDLSRHRSKIHRCHVSIVKKTASEIPADQFNQEDFISILRDAIEADEIDFVRGHYPNVKTLALPLHLDLLDNAARTASPTMVDYLLEYTLVYSNASINKARALCSAIDGENMTVIKHLIAQGADPTNPDFLERALDTYNLEIVETFLGHGAQLVEYSGIFDKICRAAAKEEDNVFKVLHRMHKYVVGNTGFSRGCRNALLRGSIPLAEYFIDNGADVNYQESFDDSLLYQLVRRGTRRDAEVIRFLLQQGVDPYPSNSKRLSIKSLAGMRKVEKYFNKSWDDLVREVQAERASMTDEE